MPNYQAEIAANVAARGYREGWTDEQYAARQVCKLGEELGELSTYIWATNGPDTQHMRRWEVKLAQLQEWARADFDLPVWATAHIEDASAAASEAADMLVVLYNLADALGVDLNALALEKSRADVERGVR